MRLARTLEFCGGIELVSIPGDDQRTTEHTSERLAGVKVGKGLELQIRRMQRGWVFNLQLHLPLDLVTVRRQIAGLVRDRPNAARRIRRRHPLQIAH